MLWIFLIATIILFFAIVLTDWAELAIVPLISAIVVIVFMFFCLCNIADGRVIDEKIEMYSQENAEIEADIDALVAEYMVYESSTLADLRGDSSITLVSLYPELKSDELVKAQLEIYRDNTEKIKDLKEAKLDIRVAKWWLYFGS
jgi:hypothetical protein